MEAPTDRLWELEFNGLPEFMKIRRRIKSNGGLLNDIVSEVIVDVHDLHTVCCEDRFLAFSQMPPFTITFPEEFFGQSNDDNVEGFLAVLRLCLLRSHSGTNINERNINTSQDDPSAKPAAPHGFDHTKGSSVHIKVKEESAPQVHSGKATQVKQVATSSLRASRSASKSSVHKPIPVSSDQNTPVGSPSIKHKHLSLQFKHLSKASNRSDHSEALKLAPSAATGSKKGTMSSVLDKELDPESVEIVQNVLHPSSSSEDATDSEFGATFKGYLEEMEQCACPIEGLTLCKACGKYWHYIENHLKDMKCPHNDCPLWKLCLKKKQYKLHEVAPKNLILFSHNPERIGTISCDYHDYNVNEPIGRGGFAVVFKHVRSHDKKILAVKEELASSSLINNLDRFAEVLDFCHPNVMFLEEYVKGCPDHDVNTPYPEAPMLFIMTHYNQQGLNAPFAAELKSLLDYMSSPGGQEYYIFRNFLVIAVDLFNALEYLKNKNLVHRDVKRSNILLKLGCNCKSAIECTCRGRGRVIALLSDFDLIEKTRGDVKWARLSDYEPSGTDGMKAPELFFIDENDRNCFSSKADVWSAVLTLIFVLLGKNERIEPLEKRIVLRYESKKVTEFFAGINSGVDDCPTQLQSCIEKLQSYCDDNKDGDHRKIIEVIEVLRKNQNNVKQMCRFQNGKHFKQGGSYIYCPAGEILTAVHVACTMPQVCITKVEHIFQSNNPLQEIMKETWRILQSGMCFRPENRPDIKEVADKFTSNLKSFLKNVAFTQTD